MNNARTESFVRKCRMNLSRIGKAAAAAALLIIYSANSHAILILDVDIGGTNRYNNTVSDGDDVYLDFSGFGGWSLTIASALAEPDFSGGSPEIHLSVIANCGRIGGCDLLTVTAASDNPRPGLFGFVDIGFVPGPGFSGSFSAFNGNSISDWTWSQGPWDGDVEGHMQVTGFGAAALWGLQAQISADGPGAGSADLRISVPEPGSVMLLGLGLILTGVAVRRRCETVA